MTKISDAVFCIVDIETTGLNPETDRIVEIACVATTATEVLGMWATLVDGRPCNAETSAIHGLTDKDLVRAPRWDEVFYKLQNFAFTIAGNPLFEEVMNPQVMAAHNAAFDKAFVEPNDDPWLCTKRLAQHLYPTAPSHRNQVLRHWRSLQVDTFGVLPHRALADCLVTAALLRDELATIAIRNVEPSEWKAIHTVEDLVAFAESPVLLLNMPHGKHRGPIADVPDSYIDWALGPRGMTDMDPDLRYTLTTEKLRRTQ